MKKHLFYLISFLLIVPVLTLADAPIINSFELPVMIHDDWLLDNDKVTYTRYPVSFDLKFYLSEQGCIDSLIYDSDDKPKFIDGVITSLRNIEFSPGKYLDKNIPVILPASLEFVYRRYKMIAKLKLPYNSITGNFDRRLIEEVLELNKFSPSSITKIPSYFCKFGRDADFKEYPYAVYEIDLDSTGEVEDIKTIFSNHQHYSDMFSSILMYTKYQLASFNGYKVASKLYLTIRFFQRLSYPTEIWPPSYERELDYSYEYHRVSIRPYLDSIINRPFPDNLIGGGMIQKEKTLFEDTIQIAVTIDVRGKVVAPKFISGSSQLVAKISKSVLKKLKYLPARDICGEKVNFEGELTLIFKNNSNNIRIISNWLKE